jgi:acyl-[acyl-carrier-protein]-phospholipid O-acyltransferase/long-chain-fatty-acid--[acyl-carrier-protein] ligase
LAITAAVDRPVRFAIAEGLFKGRWMGKLAHMLGAVPNQARETYGAVPGSLRTTVEAIKSGEVVCISTEGQILPNGELLPYKEVLAYITESVDVPIVPVFVLPTTGHVVRVKRDRLAWRLPPFFPYTIPVYLGEPMPSDTGMRAIGDAIRALSHDAYSERLWPQPLLHRAFIKTARNVPFKMGIADARSGALSYFKTLVASIILGRKLKNLLDKQPVTGVLIPPSVGGALTNIALQIMGKIPVNLNYTASNEGMAAAARRCELTQVITAHAFLERFPVEVPGAPVFLEDIMATVTKKDRIVALLMAVFLPIKRLERALGSPSGRSERDIATIIFSSGSEGEPKGVQLTHFNLLSNITGIVHSFPHEFGHGIMGILPFFHSFGFMATLWLPLTEGLGAPFHANPLEARIVGGLIKKYRPRFFIATPTFLQNFIRRCPAEDLQSLDYVLAGAEKLTPRVRNAFREKFGVEPIEGYGITECSPVVAVNAPDINVPGAWRKSVRYDTIGQPLPGIMVKALDLDTGEPTLPGQTGLMYVRGPNVMVGYLKNDEKTAAVLRDGWYETGDIAAIDEDGFITITDRLARFSKIGGEMVPHIKVEEALHELLGLTEQSLAVAGVPDEAKGERLVVLHILEEDKLEELLDKLPKATMPNLWRPRSTAFYRIDAIPVLGTGKMDIKSVKNMAQKLDLGG